MAEIKHLKVVASLPSPLEPDSIYYVRVGLGYDQYVTNGVGIVVAYEANSKLDLESKVDKESGKQLSDENYTLDEKNKLASLENYDDSTVQAELNTKVDKIVGKGLSTEDFTSAEKDKLAELENFDDSVIQAELATKVDKVVGKQLSTEDYSTEEKNKLSGVEAGAEVNSVTSVAGKTGAVTLNKADVGLSNVNNTSDSNKPVSTPQQAALNLKLDADANAVSASKLATPRTISLSGDASGSTSFDGSANATIVVQIADDSHNHVISNVDGLQTALDSKVDKVGGKQLSDENYTLVEKNKLAGVAVGATKNATDAQLRARASHTGVQPISSVSGLQSELGSKATTSHVNTQLADKVDKVVGKELSTNDFTDQLRDKLASLEGSHFRGTFSSKVALESAIPTAVAGDYADVDEAGQDAERYIWDSSDSIWVLSTSKATPLTAAQIKQLYESNPDTKPFDDAAEAKLEGIADGATANRTDTYLLSRANHTGVQEISTVSGLTASLSTKADQTSLDAVDASKVDKVEGKGLSTNDFTTTEKTKLSGIQAGATANATNAQLRDRTTHTGVQPVATVEGLQDALGERVVNTDPRLTNSREWTASVVPQAEAEAGTATTARKWTAQRVRQAITGWWNSVTSAWGRGLVNSADAATGRTALELGNVDNTKDVDKRVGSFVIHDTRDVVSVPNNVDSRSGLFEFKKLASVGSPPKPSSAAYAHVLTTNGWSADGSGGWPTQVSLGDALSFRKGTSATEWGQWRELISTDTTLGATGQSSLYPMTQKATTDALNLKANTSTQVIAGTGLSGGGTLAANRTLSVTYGTAAGTAAQGNDSRIVNAVPNSRQIISGTGLSGGGTLAANRTLSVSYGTAAGTAAQGNDSRLSNSREWTASVVSQAEAQAGAATTARKWTAQRVAQAISSLGLKIGTTSSTAKAGNWMPTWDNVTGKPTTFAPSSHTHSLSEVTDAGNLAALNTNASTSNFLRGDGTWVTPPNTTYTEISTAEIDTGTSSTRRAISGRRMKYALDKKSDTGHGHVIGDVTGLQAALDSKTNTSTQVIAGTGLLGGGSLAANRTLSVSYGTAAGTAAQGNDSRIVNAVPNSRTITAGNGLSGGGTLASNRTVTLGTPSTITGATTNSVTSTSHTHAISVTKSDVGLGNVLNVASYSKTESDGRYYTQSTANSRYAYKAGTSSQDFSAKDATVSKLKFGTNAEIVYNDSSKTIDFIFS